jgi:hypothetical protein
MNSVQHPETVLQAALAAYLKAVESCTTDGTTAASTYNQNLQGIKKPQLTEITAANS